MKWNSQDPANPMIAMLRLQYWIDFFRDVEQEGAFLLLKSCEAAVSRCAQAELTMGDPPGSRTPARASRGRGVPLSPLDNVCHWFSDANDDFPLPRGRHVLSSRFGSESE